MALSENDRIRMLEALAEDVTLKATQRLRALEELGRIAARRAGVAAAAEAPPEEAPDPMADLDEMELARQRRARRRTGKAAAQ